MPPEFSTDEINDPTPKAEEDWTLESRRARVGNGGQNRALGGAPMTVGDYLRRDYLPWRHPAMRISPETASAGNWAVQRVEDLTTLSNQMLGHIELIEGKLSQRSHEVSTLKIQLNVKTEQFEIRCREIDALLHQGNELRASLAAGNKTIDALRDQIKASRRKQPKRPR